MTTVSWPLGLPSIVEVTASGGPQPSKASFQPDVGPAIERPRSTLAPELFDMVLPALTTAQYTTFADWVKNDLKFGVLPFVFRHPLLVRFSQWRLAGEGSPYTVSYFSPGHVSIQFSAMEIDPNPPWAASVDDTLQFPDGFL